MFVELSLSSVTLGKDYAECFSLHALGKALDSGSVRLYLIQADLKP
jgi:hypothetical protein